VRLKAIEYAASSQEKSAKKIEKRSSKFECILPNPPSEGISKGSKGSKGTKKSKGSKTTKSTEMSSIKKSESSKKSD